MKDKFNNRIGPQTKDENSSSHKGYVVLIVLILLGGLTIGTQLFASMFGYQAVLGEHLHGFYLPWSIVEWSVQWHDKYPEAVMRAIAAGGTFTGVGFIVLLVAKVISRNSSKANKFLHGSARWAGIKDVIGSGLLPRKNSFLDRIKGKGAEANEGVYVGAWEDEKGRLRYLRHSGPEHILTYAPTRSGKGVGLVIPTLLSWCKSVVVTDLKGELWALTAGWRKYHANNKVIRFEPATQNGSAKWNPLDEIRLETENEVGDVQNLATLIVDPDGKGLNDHWKKTAQALLVGVIIHLLYKAKNNGEKASLPAVDAMLSDPSRDINDLWEEMSTYAHLGNGTHPVAAASARDMMDRPAEEAGSVLSTTKSYLSLFRDPVVAKNVEGSDFKIKDLMNHDNPVSLYIVTQPNDKARLKPLIRIMVNMIVRLLADKMDFEDGRAVAHYKHKLLLMLDEFPALGKLEILQESLAFLAGYGIKGYLICQDINQLKSEETGYGRNEQITSNCHIQNAFPPNRIETAEHLSKLTGETTVIKEKATISGNRASFLLNNVSRHMEEVKRNLMTPDECLRMPGPVKNSHGDIDRAGDMIIHVAGFPAIYGKQPLYFKDPVFQARAKVEAPATSDTI